MELFAYSLATSRSFILIRAITKKTNLKIFLKPTLIEIGIVIGLLLAGGFLEDYMIKLAQEEGLEMPSL
jgi:putative effector of murein hydrolase